MITTHQDGSKTYDPNGLAGTNTWDESYSKRNWLGSNLEYRINLLTIWKLFVRVDNTLKQIGMNDFRFIYKRLISKFRVERINIKIIFNILFLWLITKLLSQLWTLSKLIFQFQVTICKVYKVGVSI